MQRRPMARIPGALALARLATLAALGAAGCGDSGPKHDVFVGSWRYDAVPVAELNCNTAGILIKAPVANKVIEDGLMFPIVDVAPSPLDHVTTCSFGFVVNDLTATIAPNQSCKLAPLALDVPVPVDTGATLTPTGWRFSLVEGPNLAEEVASAKLTNVSLLDSGGNVITGGCDYSLMARLTRVATD